MKKIYDPKTKQCYLVNEVLYTSFTKEATRIRKYEQYHEHCCCPYTAIERCDGCCLDCPYRITDTLSLDQEMNMAVICMIWSLQMIVPSISTVRKNNCSLW